jgi:hypothetical protein
VTARLEDLRDPSVVALLRMPLRDVMWIIYERHTGSRLPR